MVGHIMRLAAYLCTSRHGIYYFRFPMPADCHPAGKRSHIKVSLHTRQPGEAGLLTRMLTVAGQSLLARPMLRAMRYDQMRNHVREHFGQLLHDFRERSAASGPAVGLDLDTLRASQGLAEGDASDWATMTYPGGVDGLLHAFCEVREIVPEPEGQARALMVAELQKGYREYVARAIEHTAELDTLKLEQDANPAPRTAPAAVSKAPIEEDALPFADVVSRYFDELERTNALAAKTEGEKRDALALLSELTEDKPPALMTKADAQEVKAVLFKLPKNRNKNPKTRHLPLREMLEVSGIERIAARTMNVYLGHMQSLFTWAVSNGYASENIFSGLRIKRTGRGANEGRRAFSAEQLRIMFAHLTERDSRLVTKDVHKWPALIGVFTGMRLNEIAQLEVQDIELHNEVWCINVTPDGEDNKRLKNSSSKRRVPVHDRLISSGFLEYHQAQKASGHTRLFPELTYSPQNGYGRNAGRWFNERFLLELGLGGQGLVFHCLRHTMITRLAQAGVDEPLLKALVGHSQTGMTFSTYFREGFLPIQLREAINRFDF